MQPQPPPYDPQALDAFVALAGAEAWAGRIDEIGRLAASGQRAGQTMRQRHALELTIERLRGPLARAPSNAELLTAGLAAETLIVERRLAPRGKARLRQALADAITGGGTLLPLFHMLRTAAIQMSRGFRVHFAALEQASSYDLLIARGALEAEIACDIVSAEAGRLVQRGAWARLVDGIEPDLRAWLARQRGRTLLRMTLPRGLGDRGIPEMLECIRRLLSSGMRRYEDDTAVLRIEPLMMRGLPHHAPSAALRREFGPEAHLAVTTVGGSVFAMAARAGRADEVAATMRHRLFELPARLSGTRPGILAMFLEDTDRTEWRELRERLELEGDTRQFLAHKAAEPVVAVTCASRCELFGMADAAPDGELRFRNSSHPQAKSVALGPSILSSV